MFLAFGSAAVAAADAPSPLRVADATRFRSDFGLNVDPTFIDASFSDSAFSDEDYGVPLSVAEREELARRSVVREAIEPALERAVTDPTYAGAYIDQKRGGQPVFLSTEPETLAARVGPLVKDGAAKIEFVTATRTLADLDHLRASVESAGPELETSGIELVSVGVNAVTNTVNVGVWNLGA